MKRCATRSPEWEKLSRIRMILPAARSRLANATAKTTAWRTKLQRRPLPTSHHRARPRVELIHPLNRS